MTDLEPQPQPRGLINRIVSACLRTPLVVTILTLLALTWGIIHAPFNWDTGPLIRDPVPVDAIPDIGENQQIVFTTWPGRSPQDIEDQISYPLTNALLGIPAVKSVRSYSYLGYSSIYIIFDDDAEFYWTRSRVLERLSSLPPGTLPAGVSPSLGPDATPLGQVFWYTIEGRDPAGNPAGGWDLADLRSVQDYLVRYPLLAAEGISEVASIGGFVKEYQIDIDPDALLAHNVHLPAIFNAVRQANVDVGARTIEANSVEYVIRGLGFLDSVRDLEQTVVHATANPDIGFDTANDIAATTSSRATGRETRNPHRLHAVWEGN